MLITCADSAPLTTRVKSSAANVGDLLLKMQIL